jgi:dTDP-4-amino-4,6-dideoxygalactose transaminase
MATRLTALLRTVPGVATPTTAADSRHTYWKYCLRVDPGAIPGGPTALAKDLKDLGVTSAPRYIQKPAFMCEVFQKQRTFGQSRYPFNLARPEAVDYSRQRFPGAFSALDAVLVLPWNERYGVKHVEFIADSLRRAVAASQRAVA